MLTIGSLSISASLGMLEHIAHGTGPEQALVALGYAGWAPGQLEDEIESNSWISVPLSTSLLFDSNNQSKWQQAANLQGIDLHKLSSVAGHA